ncbi:hypothetical protein LINPERHAP2_LOCUS30027 [Linum perenne]
MSMIHIGCYFHIRCYLGCYLHIGYFLNIDHKNQCLP